jgi:aquaporin Z
MRKSLVEFIGTFFLVLTVVLSVDQAQPLAAIAIGSVLMVMVYAGGHISGGHYNPGVSLAAFVRGRLISIDILPYWAAQLVGALVAALVGMYLFDYKGPVLSLSAVAFGATVAGLLEWSSIWIYLVANLAAGAAAGVVFKFVSANDP